MIPDQTYGQEQVNGYLVRGCGANKHFYFILRQTSWIMISGQAKAHLDLIGPDNAAQRVRGPDRPERKSAGPVPFLRRPRRTARRMLPLRWTISPLLMDSGRPCAPVAGRRSSVPPSPVTHRRQRHPLPPHLTGLIHRYSNQLQICGSSYQSTTRARILSAGRRGEELQPT